MARSFRGHGGPRLESHARALLTLASAPMATPSPRSGRQSRRETPQPAASVAVHQADGSSGVIQVGGQFRKSDARLLQSCDLRQVDRGASGTTCLYSYLPSDLAQ